MSESYAGSDESRAVDEVPRVEAGSIARPDRADEASGSEVAPGTGRARRRLVSRLRRHDGHWKRLALRYCPVVVVAALVIGAIAVFGGGDAGDNDGDDQLAAAGVDGGQLIREGPMTPERARLENASVNFGPDCDVSLGRIALPTVYAPPCVEPFQGDNGGATSRGVTGDTIRLAAYLRNPDPLTGGIVAGTGSSLAVDEQRQTIQGYVDLYNRVFETYERRVEVEFYTGTGSVDDTQAARADAIAIAEREPFAVIGAPDQASPEFADELAARHVICLDGCAVGLTNAFLADRAPYVWMNGGAEDGPPMTAEAIGKLAGPGTATMAGDPDLRDQDRVYGAVHYDTPDGLHATDFDRFSAALGDMGIELDADIQYHLDVNRMQENARTIIAQLEEAGVTTIIFQGEGLTAAALTTEATAQDYFPEWIQGDGYLVDLNSFARGFDQQQWGHGFSVMARDASALDINVSNQLWRWAHSDEPPSNIAPTIEPPIRMLFTGIHLAGSDLTPESFRDGILRMPPSGGGPTRSALAWADRPWLGLHDPQGDVAIAWWDPDAEGTENGEPVTGMYRFANGGQRYRSGEIPDSPETAGLFDVQSSVTEHHQLPPEDQTPDYPSPEGL